MNRCHIPIPATALCYQTDPWRVWLWSDAICGIAAFEERVGEEWERRYAGGVPDAVLADARAFFGGSYGWIGGRG